jgi:hypothetical protein
MMLNLQDIDQCPRIKLMDDLEMCLKDWRDLGEQLIVMDDFNEDVRSQNITQMFESLDMHVVIMYKHGKTAPNTCTDPIDGIFTSKSLPGIRCGYTSIK